MQNTFSIPLRLAAIHDLSGFGRTSLTVVIPILSSMGIQVCPLPTAILSTHTTEYTDFTFHDLTEELKLILAHWKKLNLTFDATYSGFLATPEQVNIVAHCIDNHLKKTGIAIIDPVMGDNGKLDATMTLEMVSAMRSLVSKANIITPNFTETCFLLEEEPVTVDDTHIKKYLKRLTALGPEIAVITSVPHEDSNTVSVAAYDKINNTFHTLSRPYIPAFYPGTGDTFSSVLIGALLQKHSLKSALEKAVHFVTLGIETTYQAQTIPREGILLESILHTLIEK